MFQFKSTFVAALVAGFMALSSLAQAATVGEAAPDFTLPAADGGTIHLADLKDKIVVLEWFNKDCPFVRKHYDTNNMQRLQKEYVGKDVVWLTINSSAEGMQGYEEAADALKTIEEKGMGSSHLLLDPAGNVGKLYEAKTTPHMFVIGKDGTLVYAGAIDDTASADKEDVKTAKNYVRAALEAVFAGQAVEVATSKSYGCGVKYAN